MSVIEEVLVDDNEEVKTTWRIPKTLLRQFKHIAADNDTSVSYLVVQAMKEFVERKNKK